MAEHSQASRTRSKRQKSALVSEIHGVKCKVILISLDLIFIICEVGGSNTYFVTKCRVIIP